MPRPYRPAPITGPTGLGPPSPSWSRTRGARFPLGGLWAALLLICRSLALVCPCWGCGRYIGRPGDCLPGLLSGNGAPAQGSSLKRSLHKLWTPVTPQSAPPAAASNRRHAAALVHGENAAAAGMPAPPDIGSALSSFTLAASCRNSLQHMCTSSYTATQHVATPGRGFCLPGSYREKLALSTALQHSTWHSPRPAQHGAIQDLPVLAAELNCSTG